MKRRKATLGLTAYDYGSLEQDMALVAQVVEHAPSINLDDGYRQVRPLPLVFALPTVSGAQVAACLRSLNVNMGEKRVQAALARLYPEAVYERRNYLQRRCERAGRALRHVDDSQIFSQHSPRATALQVLFPRLEHGLELEAVPAAGHLLRWMRRRCDLSFMSRRDLTFCLRSLFEDAHLPARAH